MNEYIFIMKFQYLNFYINFTIFHNSFVLAKFCILSDFALLLNKNQLITLKETKILHFKRSQKF